MKPSSFDKKYVETSYLIRQMDVADLPALSAIDSETFGSEAYTQFFFRQIYDLHYKTVFVAVLKGTIIGYCYGAPTSWNWHRGWILSIVVSRDCRGQGCGSRLLCRTIDALREIGCNEALLTVHPENNFAKAIFEKHGFVVIKTESEYFGPGQPRDIMRVML